MRDRSTIAFLVLLGWAAVVAAGFVIDAPVPRAAHPDEEGGESLRQRIRLLEEENRALTEQLELRGEFLAGETGGFHPIPARLHPIEDLSPRRRSALLDRGRADGVAAGMGVVSLLGVVGRVAAVGEHHARVLLADDPEFRVAYAVEGRSTTGLAAGGPTPGLLHTLFHGEAGPLESGDELFTAGGDGVFPAGYRIGTLDRTRVRGDAFRIDPSQDFLHAGWVLALSPTPVVARDDRP